MYRTSGDMIYNPATNQWQPIAGNPLPPYAPQGGDPLGGAGMALTPSLSEDARKLHLEELRKLGLPLPPEPGGQQASHTGDASHGAAPEELHARGLEGDDGDRHVVGPPVELDTLGEEVTEDAPEPPRRAHDTDRPPPRRGGKR